MSGRQILVLMVDFAELAFASAIIGVCVDFFVEFVWEVGSPMTECDISIPALVVVEFVVEVESPS